MTSRVLIAHPCAGESGRSYGAEGAGGVTFFEASKAATRFSSASRRVLVSSLCEDSIAVNFAHSAATQFDMLISLNNGFGGSA
jgi:hypothetical protein